VIKTIPIGERMKIQLPAEMFNVVNRKTWLAGEGRWDRMAMSPTPLATSTVPLASVLASRSICNRR
jgi:hypothetical protein